MTANCTLHEKIYILYLAHHTNTRGKKKKKKRGGGRERYNIYIFSAIFVIGWSANNFVIQFPSVARCEHLVIPARATYLCNVGTTVFLCNSLNCGVFLVISVNTTDLYRSSPLAALLIR